MTEPKKQTQKRWLVDRYITILRELGLPEWIEEYQGIPNRKFLFDFAWVDKKVAVEIEGGTFMKKRGAHVRPVRYARDCEKYNLAQLNGWSVYRFTSDMLKNGKAHRQTIMIKEKHFDA